MARGVDSKVRGFVEKRLEEVANWKKYDESRPPLVRVTVRLELHHLGELECGAKLLDMTKTGLAERLLQEAIGDLYESLGRPAYSVEHGGFTVSSVESWPEEAAE